MVLKSTISLPKDRVELRNCYLGYTVAKDVYKDRDMLLLSAGHVLTEAYIEKLRLNGVKYIYVYPDKKKEHEVSQIIAATS
ncbi:hypothetical protein ACFVS2_25050 [Brevibacillus sp. NPDC058079]|uniref:hypothetical protein n=1 Tax=Brevibacillus sp. NPDC058079 TaxID=3346330 RepID=UPI0036E2A5DD